MRAAAPFQSVTDFLKKQLKLQEKENLVCCPSIALVLLRSSEQLQISDQTAETLLFVPKEVESKEIGLLPIIFSESVILQRLHSSFNFFLKIFSYVLSLIFSSCSSTAPSNLIPRSKWRTYTEYVLSLILPVTSLCYIVGVGHCK